MDGGYKQIVRNDFSRCLGNGPQGNRHGRRLQKRGQKPWTKSIGRFKVNDCTGGLKSAGLGKK
jgi:hypothetical protein